HLPRARQALLPAGGAEGPIALLLEDEAEHLGAGQLVVDDKNGLHTAALRLLGGTAHGPHRAAVARRLQRLGGGNDIAVRSEQSGNPHAAVADVGDVQAGSKSASRIFVMVSRRFTQPRCSTKRKNSRLSTKPLQRGL